MSILVPIAKNLAVLNIFVFIIVWTYAIEVERWMWNNEAEAYTVPRWWVLLTIAGILFQFV